MINASETFKKNIKQFGKEIAIRLSYDDIVVVNQNIKSVTLTKNDGLFKSSMRAVDVILYGKYDLKDKEISIDFGVSFDKSDYEYVHFGTFIPYVDSISYSFERNETSLTCYDKLIMTHVPYNLDLTIPNKGITVDVLLKAICSYFSFEFIDTTYINKTGIITKDNYNLMLNIKPTFRDVLDYIAQITASLIIIEDNELRLVYPIQTEYVFDGSNLKSLKVSERLGPFNRVSFTQKETEDDEKEIYFREDSNSIQANGKNEISFENSPLWSDDLLDAFFNQVKGFIYYVFDITSFGFCYFNPLEIIDIQYADHVYQSMITNDIITVESGLDESLYTEKENSNTNDYTSTLDSEKSINYINAIYNQIYSEKFKGIEAEFQTIDSNFINVSENLTALNAKIDNLDVGNLEAKYAKIDLSNVEVEHVSNLFADVGLIQNATIVDGHITGTLTGVKITGDLIEANTLAVKDLLLQGQDGLIYQINALASGLSQTELSKDIYQQKLNGTDIVANSITGDQIAANSIAANEIDVADLFAQDITATGTITGMTLKGGNININDKFIVTPAGILTAVDGNFTGVVNATSGTFDNVTATDLTVESGTFKGDIATNSDAYIGNNLYLGDQGTYTKKYIYFRSDCYILGSASGSLPGLTLQARDIKLNCGDIYRIRLTDVQNTVVSYDTKGIYFEAVEESVKSLVYVNSESFNIYEPLNVTGNITTAGRLYTNNKSAVNDGVAGVAITSAGGIYLTSDATPTIYFYRENATSATHNIQARTDDIYLSKKLYINGSVQSGGSIYTNTNSIMACYNSTYAAQMVGGDSYARFGLRDNEAASVGTSLYMYPSYAKINTLLRSDGAFYSGGKTATADGKAGIVIGAGGGIALCHNTTPFIDFYYGNATARSSRIYASSATRLTLSSDETNVTGILYVSGYLLAEWNSSGMNIGYGSYSASKTTTIFGKVITMNNGVSSVQFLSAGSSSTEYNTVLRAATTGVTLLGSSSYRWYGVYATHAENISSDIRLKTNIREYDDRYEKMYRDLKPILYALKNEPNQTHCGLIAQWTKNAMDKHCIKDDEFSVYHHDHENDEYGIVYTELISLNMHMIQKTITRVDEQEIRLKELESKYSHLQEENRNLREQINALILN